MAEVALAVEELTDQGFATGEVAVGLHPHRAHGFPLAACNGLFDPCEQRWEVLLKPLVLTRLRVHKGVLGVTLHQGKLGGGGVRHFEFGDGNRPEPCGVKVRVTHGVDGVLETATQTTQGVADDLAALRNALATLGRVEVHHIVQSPQNRCGGGILLVNRIEETERERDIVEQVLQRKVNHDEFRAVHLFAKRGPRRLFAMNGGLRVTRINLDVVFQVLAAHAKRFAVERVALQPTEVAVHDVYATPGHIVLPDRALAADFGDDSQMLAIEFRWNRA